MEPFEVMVSESQERMLCVVEPERARRRARASASAGRSRGTAIGEVTDTGRLRVLDGDELVGDMPVRGARRRLPALRPRARAARRQPLYPPPARDARPDATTRARRCSRCSPRPNIASRRPLFEQYDSIVQSRTVRRPEQADAAVLRCPTTAAAHRRVDRRQRPPRGLRPLPRRRSRRCSSAPPTSPASAPSRSGSTNCLNFGNPEKPHIAWQLDARGARARRRLPRARRPGRRRQRLALQRGPRRADLPDAGRRHGRRAARPARAPARARASPRDGDAIALAGPFAPSLPARELAKLRGEPLPDGLPEFDAREVARGAGGGPRRRARRRRSRSAHDIAEGGLAVALAECCLAGGVGARVELRAAGDERGPTCSARARGVRRQRPARRAGRPRRARAADVARHRRRRRARDRDRRVESGPTLAELRAAAGRDAAWRAVSAEPPTSGVAALLARHRARRARSRRRHRMCPTASSTRSSVTDRATSAASSASTRPSTTSPDSRTSPCTRSSTAARSPRGSRPSENGHIMTLRELGLVNQVFDEHKLRALAGRAGDRPRALLDDRLQRLGERPAGAPLATARELALAHNGNLINAVELHDRAARARRRVPLDLGLRDHRRAALHPRGRAHRGRDRRRAAAPAGRVLDRRHDPGRASSPSATRTACARWRSAQARATRYCVASESCAFDIIGAELLREVEPGEMVSLGERGHRDARRSSTGARRAFCVFEHIYFARPDSQLEGNRYCRSSRRRWARSSGARRPSRPTW